MSTIDTTKNERINLRLKSSAKRLLERAASFESKTVSSFILGCALAQAEKTIHQQDIMTLSANYSKAFLEALTKPVNFNRRLSKALDEHAERVISK